jgi:hypothetical protein
MIGHGGDIARHQHAASLSGNAKNFRIKCTVRKNAGGFTKIDLRFPPPEPSADLRIQVSVSLKA